ncbi:hypothetical protein DSL92_01975 [Billgrantia gudaonensis]|uniref:Uncharacterized protein n=1 Tax=Billgrantia gudaonensis TaxID=376427 RepID=A0A432JKB7_9GAMM|nr:hypothetical protein DSL92_01975 [Halomonas gudaonensis]
MIPAKGATATSGPEHEAGDHGQQPMPQAEVMAPTVTAMLNPTQNMPCVGSPPWPAGNPRSRPPARRRACPCRSG